MCFLANYRRLKVFVTDAGKSVVVGGDFNVIIDQDLDGRGGNNKRKDSVQYVEDMIIEHDLVDIYGVSVTPLARVSLGVKNHR